MITFSLDNIIDGNIQQPPIQGWHLYAAASQCLAQENPGHKHQIIIGPLEARMRLIPDDEDDVGGDDVGSLVGFLRESDPGAFPPSLVNCDSEDLIPCA